MNKWLTPSSINFLKMHKQMIVEDEDEQQDNPVTDLTRKLTADSLKLKVPKIQVSEKDGQMFALNNSLLQLMRKLEKSGKLTNGLIQVEIVPLSKVPANIQLAMVVDHTSFNEDSTEELSINVKLQENGDLDQISSVKTGHTIDTNINNSEDESDREDYEDDEEEDDNEQQSSGSSTSDEAMQCNVCDRTYTTANLLARHQIKKKHFGCSVCDTVFPSLRELEEHKQSLDHWSDDENQQNEDNDSHNPLIKHKREEIERLL